jgi:hypothetical protein
MPSLTSLQSKAFMFLEWINPLPWFAGSGDQRPKATLVISQGESDLWRWELIDEDGFVHGRSAIEVFHRTHALASARYAQFMILDSLITDERGREI